MAGLVAAALLFMLWLAGLLTWGKIAPGTVALEAQAVPGKTLTVQEEVIPQELAVLGAVVSRTFTQVSAQIPGRVRRVWVEAGSRVKKGDPLVSLSAEEYQARLSQAQAQLAKISADYRRYRRLLKEGAVSPQEFEALEARYKSAQAQVKEAATLTSYTLVAAPRDAVVAERRTAVGDLAQPGQPLLSLYDPGDLQVEGEVNDDYRSQVRPGSPVRLEVPAAGWQGEAALTEIFPISQSASRTFKVRTGLIAEPHLVPGMFARLYLPVGESRGLLIPQAAVRQVGQLTMVEGVVEGRPSLRQVKLGRSLGDRVEVLAGLKPGDRIVVP